MEYPPSKRLKGFKHEAPPEHDPFGDEEFTQDDLDEIDIIASQAITGDVPAPGMNNSVGTCPGEQPKPAVHEGRRTFSLGSSHHFSNSAGGSNITNSSEQIDAEGFGKFQKNKDKNDAYYNKLEAQQAELKEKLKKVEDEILMKNGEICVLRDSLRLANQERDQQRQAQLLLERERAHAQSEREKELAKKVQSLQSELHFKEAEMNEMKSKLQTFERGGKLLGTPTRNSVASPVGRSFITKETFSAELSKRPSPIKHQDGKENETAADLKEETRSVAFHISDHQGPVLLNLLLQHPLDPSSLGLCHLLCISPDVLPNLLSQSNYVSLGSSSVSSNSVTDSTMLHRSQGDLSQLQCLAMSGLTTLAFSHTSHIPQSPDSVTQTTLRSCPGAVHLLPLLCHHIGLYCQTLESIDSSGKSPLQGSSLSGSSEGTHGSTVEESLGSQEEFALAAVKAVYHIVSRSTEAVRTILSCRPQENAVQPGGTAQHANQPECSRAPEASDRISEGLQTQHPLLKKLLQLADPTFVCSANQMECVVNSSLRALCMLADKAEEEELWRFKCVMSSQALTRCMSLESSYQTVCLSVRLLAIIIHSEELATQLCSHFYACPLLKVFLYITSRPDKTVTQDAWCHLEIEVVRLLMKLFTQRASTWAAFIDSSCQCNSEVVRTLVVVLHRQWLVVKRRDCQTAGAQVWASPRVQLLRECLMLLHWLLLNDSLFSEHCLDVLHMYEQVIPAIRDTFRKISNLSEGEELALEEICGPEADDGEDMEIDAGS
ncbi:ATR-interacting protein [Chanos chanos]|uniref:ATR-interacting protein n=1 Tax=Chanos chanos TaxID=29144 RepID=A0A6J2VQ43_CHACN|nr:ATR-interacting protein [Chanos chanos]